MARRLDEELEGRAVVEQRVSNILNRFLGNKCELYYEGQKTIDPSTKEVRTFDGVETAIDWPWYEVMTLDEVAKVARLRNSRSGVEVRVPFHKVDLVYPLTFP